MTIPILMDIFLNRHPLLIPSQHKSLALGYQTQHDWIECHIMSPAKLDMSLYIHKLQVLYFLFNTLILWINIFGKMICCV